jgi:hypothetical protein
MGHIKKTMQHRRSFRASLAMATGAAFTSRTFQASAQHPVSQPFGDPKCMIRRIAARAKPLEE